MLTAWLMVGCGPGGPAPTAQSGGGGAVEPWTPVDIAWELSPEVQTVARVRWQTASPTTGFVRFGEPQGDLLETPPTALGTEHEVQLLGLHASSSVDFVVWSEGDGTAAVSKEMRFETGPLPSALPTLSISGSDPRPGYQIVPLQGATFAAAILDMDGRYVWYDSIEQIGSLMRVLLSHDRQSLIYCRAGERAGMENGELRWVNLWGDTVREHSLPYMDHDIVELPGGTVAAIVWAEGPNEMWANAIVEVGLDGSQTEIWNAWDHLDPDDFDLEEHDNWVHSNGLDYDPVEDVYYLSMRGLRSLNKIDRSTGEMLWSLHGQLNQFDYIEGHEPIEIQHQFQVLPDDRLLVFDNGSLERGASRVVELQLDFDQMTVSTVWDYVHEPDVYIYAKGDVHRFDDGVTQAIWSTAGRMQRVDAAGNVLWQLDNELGQAITFVDFADRLYPDAGAR